jgi:hypothetical protein
MKKFLFLVILAFLLTVLMVNPAQAQSQPASSCSSNFLTCVTSRFGDKFPFDIFANIEPAEIACPSISFFERPFDVCFIYETVRVLKYPLVASLLIKMYIFS